MSVIQPFDLPFFRTAVIEVLVLAICSGVIGTWIVLRGLAFYTHAVAAATFPGVVLASGLGFAATAGAFGAGVLFAVSVGRLSTRRHSSYDSLTALALVGSLALGTILASDVFHSGSQVDSLLFGSLLAVSNTDVAVAGVAAVAALAFSIALGPRWLTVGFDRDAGWAIGLRSSAPDLILLLLVALLAVAALTAVGALLVTALLVVPAVTTRLWTSRMTSWQITTAALAAVEGVGGLLLAFETNAPPGAAIATLAGGVFAVAALGNVAARRRRAALAKRV